MKLLTPCIIAGKSFFNLTNDPAEKNNLADHIDYQEIVNKLKQQLAQHLIQTTHFPHQVPQMDNEQAILRHCLRPYDAVG